HALQRHVLLAHRAGDGLLAGLDRGVAALLGEPVLDLVAGAGALDEAEPVPAGARVRRLGGEHLDGVAVVEGRFEGDETPVDTGADTSVPDLGVDGVREVDGAAPCGSAITSPFRVNTNTSETDRSNRSDSRNSAGSAVSFCQSRSWRSHCMSPALRPPTVSSLYFQCAATPYSARRCMPQVRICSSTGLPPGPITVV